MTVGALRERWEAGEHKGVLTELLVRWRSSRSPLLAELIVALEPAGDLRGPTVAEVRKAWRTGDVREVGRAVAGLFALPPDRALALVRRGGEWLDDPRAVQALLDALHTLPRGYGGAAALAFWGEVLRFLAGVGDPRVAPALARLTTSMGRAGPVGSLLRSHSFPVVQPSEPLDRDGLEAWLASIRPVPTEALIEQVYQDPGDLELREVLADRLVEVGDPRGEAIALELAGRSAQALIHAHGRSWLGAIAPMVNQTRFRLGFVDHARLRPLATIDPALPEWRTLRSLDLSTQRDLGPFLAGLPLLRAVGGVRDLTEIPHHLQSLSVRLPRPELHALLRSGSWPALEELTATSGNRGERFELRGPVGLALRILTLWGFEVEPTVHRWPGAFELRLMGPWIRTLRRDADGNLTRLAIELPGGRGGEVLGGIGVALEGLAPGVLTEVEVRIGRRAVTEAQRDIGRSVLQRLASEASLAFV